MTNETNQTALSGSCQTCDGLTLFTIKGSYRTVYEGELIEVALASCDVCEIPSVFQRVDEGNGFGKFTRLYPSTNRVLNFIYLLASVNPIQKQFVVKIVKHG